MGSSPLSKIPITRIVVPFGGGIVLGNYFPPVPILATVSLAIIGCAIAIMMSMLSRTPESRSKVRPFSIIPIIIISLALGWTIYSIHQPSVLNLSQTNSKLGYGRIESIDFKERSMYMTVDMLSSHAQGSTILLTTKGCNYSLTEGDNVAFVVNLQRISNPNMPEDTDFALIQKRKGIIYQQHIDAKAVTKYGHTDTFGNLMTKARKRIIASIHRTTLSLETKHYIIALLLGDRKHIDQQTRSEYSYAGLSHVLALSGLHIGIIMIFIWLLLWPLDFYQLKKLRFVLSVVIVIFYDVLTGLPPSVVRATVMITFTFATFIFGRKATAVNSLMASALLILAFSPESLFNAGFQLSFITVLFILILSPSNKQIKTKRKWLRYLITLIVTSVIAMGATIALTAYYFHTISWAGFISNALILPIFPIFMGIAVLIILLACGDMNIDALNHIADMLVTYANSVARFISQLPFSVAKEVYFSEYDVLFYFICITFLTLFIKRRKWLYMNLCIANCAFAVVLHTLTLNSFPTSGCVAFNAYDCTPIVFYQDGNAYYWTPDDGSKFKPEDFRRQHTGFFAAHGIDTFTEANDSSKIQNVALRSPYARIFSHTILMAGNNRWKKITGEKKVNIDFCVITKRFNGTVEDLARLYNIKHMVISGNVYEPNTPSIIDQCRRFGIKCLNLREKSLIID